MPRTQKTKRKKLSKTLITVVAVLVLCGGAVLALKVAHRGPFASKQTKQANVINYDPPTKEEKQATEDHKKTIAEGKDGTPTNPPQDGSGLRKVAPFITIAQQFQDPPAGDRVEIRAYIADLVEGGGSCEAVLTKGGRQVKKITQAQADATTTSCDTFIIARSEIPESGTWSVTVTYTSSTAKGTSDATQVEVK